MNDNKNTEAWYRSAENGAISPSRAKAYRESKEWYARRYLKGEQEEPGKDFLIGLVVDHAFNTGSVESIADRFTDDKAEVSKTRLTPADYAKATEMARQLLATPLELEDGEAHTQEPLYATIKKRYGKKTDTVDICGLPDQFRIIRDSKGKIRFIDLLDIKTAKESDVASDKAWYWTCVRYGYFAALAVYSGLLQRTYGVKPHQIRAKHIVVGKTARHGKYPIKLVKIPRTLYQGYWTDFIATAFAIKRETAWVDPVPQWSVLKDPNDQLVGFAGTDDEE